MHYPRPGESIVPRLLRSLAGRAPPFPGTRTPATSCHTWSSAPTPGRGCPPETCQRLSMLVVDRVRTRVRALPDVARETTRCRSPASHSPFPSSAAPPLPFARRFRTPLRRAPGRSTAISACPVSEPGPSSTCWRRRRPATMRAPAPNHRRRRHRERCRRNARSTRRSSSSRATFPSPSSAPTPSFCGAASVQRARSISKGSPTGPSRPFRSSTSAGPERSSRSADVPAARATHRIATRVVQGWGAATIKAVEAQLGAVVEAIEDSPFVERLLVGIATFRWLDRQNGWFWFAQGSNPLVNDMRKILLHHHQALARPAVEGAVPRAARPPAVRGGGPAALRRDSGHTNRR